MVLDEVEITSSPIKLNISILSKSPSTFNVLEAGFGNKFTSHLFSLMSVETQAIIH